MAGGREGEEGGIASRSGVGGVLSGDGGCFGGVSRAEAAELSAGVRRGGGTLGG